ncbi:nitroreductase family protein [Yanghanlia caeni]|uniref:Putative NAD(P)H nitroreductase n=1 Tax=Yanghanlia caeni TaxID=3064283 RepID=A0ABU1D8U7_9BURK|nr:nitroreductase [Alcaligenaceae bacterium LG-2]NGR06489.1 nitroreductase [bacterium SGD-2]HZH57799.1 nitroreductase [Burkholderiaceae bacterium]
MSEQSITYLLNRQSIKFVRAPGPDEHQLKLILQAAMSAPDHGRLRPWRFALIRQDVMPQFVDKLFATAQASDSPIPPQKEENARRWLKEVPLLIALACHRDHGNVKIPEHERMLAVGAAAMNMLNAAHMLGFGAFWSTGLGTYIDEVNEMLGFDPLDYRFMGYLAVGTPIDEVFPVTRPDFRQFVKEYRP